MGHDNGLNGKIAAGDFFEIRVTEILHPDESIGSWPETGIKVAEEFTVSLNAIAGETSNDVRDRLLALINSELAVNSSVHLPTVVADGSNGIRFLARKPGEDFDVTMSYHSIPDSMDAIQVKPNVLQTSYLNYSLADGSGSEDNGLFSIDANGTLRTATVFDYENNASSYTVRVRVNDEFNASTERDFVILLTDLNDSQQ